MFNATFYGAESGVGKQSGRSWFKISLAAETTVGGIRLLEVFCTENAFRTAQTLDLQQPCHVLCGVDSRGNLCINALKGV